MRPWLESFTRRLAVWNRRRLHRRQQGRRPAYQAWCARHDTLDDATLDALRARAERAAPLPEIDILVRAGGQPLADHQALVDALRGQLVTAWRAHIAFDAEAGVAVRAWWRDQAAADGRIRCVAENSIDGGTDDAEASALLARSAAPWCSFVEPGDAWRPHALLLLAEAAAHWPDARLVFADEDRLDEAGQRSIPWFKGDFDRYALWAHDSVGGPAVWRSAHLRERLAGPALERDAWHHDLALRATHALPAAHTVHVPHVLAHRRAPRRWVAAAACGAVQAELDRTGVAGQATPDAQATGLVRVHLAMPEPSPAVTIVIPTRNGLHLLRRCVTSILQRSTYSHYDIVIVDNGSDNPACLRWLQAVVADPRVSVRRDGGPFNFAALNNAAVASARGEFVALVNNDIEVITPGWIEDMLGLAALPAVGAVGARLWYGDDTLQHAGVVLGVGSGAGHVLKRLRRDKPGPASRAWLLQAYLAVTAACLMVRRSLYLEVGGMDEAAFAVAFNDVDFCCRLAAAGRHNLWTPHAELYHHESVTRGKDDDPVHRERFAAELARLRARWPHWLRADPFYNPNLTLLSEDLALADPPRVSLRRPWFEGDVDRAASTSGG